jgi:hypothetical protein
MTRGPDLRPAGFCCPGNARPRPGAIKRDGVGLNRHCEEQSDEAIQFFVETRLDCFAGARNDGGSPAAAVGLITLAISGLVLIVLWEIFA